MKRLAPALFALSAFTLPAAGIAGAGVASAASAHMPTHAVLHVASAVKGRAAFRHVMASAKLRYTQHDVFVTVTADHLPRAASLGKRAYVVYVSDGHMTDRLGALHVHGAMAGISGQVMMSRVTDIYVYAESSPANKHPRGTEVLGAML